MRLIAIIGVLNTLACGGEGVKNGTPPESDTEPTPLDLGPESVLFIGCHVPAAPDTDAVLEQATGLPAGCDLGMTASLADVPELESFRLDESDAGLAFTWQVRWPEDLFVQPSSCHTFSLVLGDQALTWEHVLESGIPVWRRAGDAASPDARAIRDARPSKFGVLWYCDWPT